MPEEPKKGLLDGVINAVSNRDEVAAAQAAKKEAEEANARASAEFAKRGEAEARATRAEADARMARAQVEQEIAKTKAAEIRAQAAETKAQVLEAQVQALQAQLAGLQQQLEQAKVRTYVVKAGDSLSKIAQQVYGDAKRWPEIYEANKNQIKDPNVIHPGQELRIP